MKKNSKEINIPVKDAMNDLRREREILAKESIDYKGSFADNIKDRLGEEIKRELLRKEVIVEEPIVKKSKIQNFLDKLTKICR